MAQKILIQGYLHPIISVKVAKITTPFWTDRVQREWWLICVCVITQVTKQSLLLIEELCWSQEHKENFTYGSFDL